MFVGIKKRLEVMALTKKFEGVSYMQQAMDLIPILLGKYNLGLSDYYDQRLYRLFRTEPEKIRDYLGWRLQQHISYLLAERKGVTAAWDKLVFEYLMRARGFPTPPLKAVYKPDGAGFENVTDLTNTAELGAFLRTEASYPFYLKAAFSEAGSNSFACLNYSPATDTIKTALGDQLPVDALIAQITRDDEREYRGACGWLFQELIKPHPTVFEATGSNAISSARVIVFREKEGPRVAYALWRIATGKSYNDNFIKGKSGNWISWLDVETGRIVDPKCTTWPYAADPAMKTHANAALDGFLFPEWDKALACVKAASSMMPLMRIQHWDVAPTDRGPVLLEVNDLGGLSQIHCHGILDDGLRKMVLEVYNNPVYLHTAPHKKWVKRI